MQWDLYCRVVDNLGDIGIAWRLAADLAGRGESVRLAVDDASALAWMAPHGAAGVEVVGWNDGPSAAPDVRRRVVRRRPADAAVARDRAAAGAGQPRAPERRALRRAIARHCRRRRIVRASRRRRPGSSIRASRPRPAACCASPACSSAAANSVEATRGSASIGIASRAGERRVSLFCYPQAPLAPLLDALAASPTLLLLAPGRRRRSRRRDPRPFARRRELARGAPAASRAGRLRPPALVVRAQLRSRRRLVRARDLGRRALRLAGLRPGRRRSSRQGRGLSRPLPRATPRRRWPRGSAACSRAGTAAPRERSASSPIRRRGWPDGRRTASAGAIRSPRRPTWRASCWGSSRPNARIVGFAPCPRHLS